MQTAGIIRMPNGTASRLCRILILFSLLAESKRYIKLPQRPTLAFHGLAGYCDTDYYKELKAKHNIECFRISEFTESFLSFTRQTEAACKKFAQMVTDDPEKYKRGVYIYGYSFGAILAKYLMQYCPAFGALVRRMVTLGVPQLGTKSFMTQAGTTTLGAYSNRLSMAPVFAYFALKHAFLKSSATSAWDLLTPKIGDSNVIKQLAYDSYRANNWPYTQLELFLNVRHSLEDVLTPASTCSFGAEYSPQTDTLQKFPTTPAYKLNLFGLRTLYKKGNFLNCIMKGVHAYPEHPEEEEQTYEVLRDNCVFEASQFDFYKEEELYKMCLALKLTKSHKAAAMTCDPSADELRRNAHVQARIKGIRLDHKQLKESVK